MVSQERINVRDTVGRKNNCKLNFFQCTSFEITKKYICLLKIADTSFKKETLVQVFSCEFCEISKNTFFTEHLWTAASVLSRQNFSCKLNFLRTYS